MVMEMTESRHNLTDAPNNTLKPRFECLNTKTKLEKQLAYFGVSSLIVSFCLLIALIVVSSKSNPKPNTDTTISEEHICESEQCHQIAQEFHSYMDTTVDPCDDFYTYACGGWIKDSPLPPVALEISRFSQTQSLIDAKLKDMLSETYDDAVHSKAIKKAMGFYKSCSDGEARDKAKYTAINDFITKIIGGWPLIDKDWTEDKFNWTSAVVGLNTYGIRGRIVAIGVRSFPDSKEKNLLYMIPNVGDMGKSDDDEKLPVYKELIKKTANYLKKEEDEISDEDVDDIIAFEQRLAEITNNGSVNGLKDYSFEIFNDRFKSANWTQMVIQAFEGTDITIQDDQSVYISHENFFKRFDELLDNKTLLANYLGWRAAYFLSPFSTVSLRADLFKFENLNYKVEQQATLEHQCLEFGKSFFPDALGLMYYQKDYDKEREDHVKHIANQLRESFAVLLETNDWMDVETKQRAKEKLDSMSQEISSPSYLNSTEAVDSIYDGASDFTGDFTNSVIEYYEWASLKSLSTLRNPVNHYVWDNSVFSVNAFYSTIYNKIVIPLAGTELPFFANERPDAINFASMGFLVGHEITHGFDDTGRKYDSNGDKCPDTYGWWSERSYKKSEERMECLEKQYSNYKIPTIDKSVNGRQTLGENIADNGGLRESYKAFLLNAAKYGDKVTSRLPKEMQQFSSRQLFFISFANLWCNNMRPSYLETIAGGDKHPPSQYRVLGTLSNSADFAKAFKCPVGSKMNPTNKCTLW